MAEQDAPHGAGKNQDAKMEEEPRRPARMAFHLELGEHGKAVLPAWFSGAQHAEKASWDAGFDFDDPRVISTPDGRSLLVAVMADEKDLDCLSVPRRIVNEGGLLRLEPAAELNALHTFEASLDPHAGGLFQHHRADLRFDDIQPGHFMFALDNALEFEFKDGRLMMGFVGDFDEGHGRPARSLEVSQVRSLRVLVDDTTAECFINGGEHVMSTRWFPVTRTMLLAMKIDCLSARAFGMDEGVERLYAPLQ